MTNKTDHRRKPKKTVSIEVRVSEEDKHDFMSACRSAGWSASEAMRRLMRLFVGFQFTRHRMLEMMKRHFFRPVRTALTALTVMAAVSASLILAPTASADKRLAYLVKIDDGIGQIVSMGETDFTNPNSVSDYLGEDIRFTLAGVACDATVEASCEPDQLVLHVDQIRDGEVWAATAEGIEVSQTGETRYETVLSDGRTLTVIVAHRT